MVEKFVINTPVPKGMTIPRSPGTSLTQRGTDKWSKEGALVQNHTLSKYTPRVEGGGNMIVDTEGRYVRVTEGRLLTALTWSERLKG